MTINISNTGPAQSLTPESSRDGQTRLSSPQDDRRLSAVPPASAAGETGRDNTVPDIRPAGETQADRSGEGPSLTPDERLEEQLNALLGNRLEERHLRIERDEETNRFVYQTVNRETGEVVEQFPPETLLDLIRSIREAEGLVLDTDV